MADRTIKSVNLLPEFFRTDKNSKFLAATIDQLIQPPQLERIDGFVGTKFTPNYVSTSDVYVTESLKLRQNYQLEPALVVRDNLTEIKDVIGIDDITNQIKFYGGNPDNFNITYQSDQLSYDPHIDMDKFVNFQNYYWLTNGPDLIVITGKQLNSTSTFTVIDNDAETSFIFTPNGLTEDPVIVLYRGNTYTFIIDSIHNFWIKTDATTGTGDQYNTGVTNNGIHKGKITFIVDDSTPSSLFYCSEDSPLAQGRFLIKTITEDSIIDVEDEIVGKTVYESGTGINLSNGMKIRFGGDVYPDYYKDKEFFVEGVGKAITLVDIAQLDSNQFLTQKFTESFDGTSFDTYPFDNDKKLPIIPEYVTINRASRDSNTWSRYNRWVHKDIIEASALANDVLPSLPADLRAKRPIIEFKANLKLWNHGSLGLADVDVIDTITVDAFSLVEGSAGFYVDGVLLEQGNRVIFAADEDEDVRDRIYEVNYVFIDGVNRLELIIANQVNNENNVLVHKGKKYKGTTWWYDGIEWKQAQEHVSLNQAPLFDLFDENGQSYSLDLKTSFSGNKIFGYQEGTGVSDPILGFPLQYRNSSGLGSYLFKNYFSAQSIDVSLGFDQVEKRDSSTMFCRYSDVTGYRFENIWKATENYTTPIIELTTTIETTSTIQIKSIDKPSTVAFNVDVFLGKIKVDKTTYITTITNNKAFLQFDDQLLPDTDLTLKIYTDVVPNNFGYYEVPLTFTNNPLNGTIGSLTLSQLADNLSTIVYSNPEFGGEYPGSNNLKDLSGYEKYGTRIVSHVHPISFAQFFVGKKEHSVIDALSKAADQYNQFKLDFLKKVLSISNQLDPVKAVDEILKDLNSDKDVLSPYFLSDMVPYGTDKTSKIYTVKNITNKIYPLVSQFNLNSPKLSACLIYLNNQQLIYGTEYIFVPNDSAFELLIDLSVGDTILVNTYQNTEGSFIPPTPSKLGLFPKFVPSIYQDDTYIVPKNVIQCHDGSIVVAYNDYRDNILLELEKRIYNNIKVNYETELLDINSALPGAYRNIGYTENDINKIIERDFIKWSGSYGVDSYDNSSFDESNVYTYNFNGSYNQNLSLNLHGSWRAIYRQFFDTDRPHTHPWEMLGFYQKPDWWEDEYGPAPYTSGNEILWEDLAAGRIRSGARQGVDPLYKRPQLLSLLPVDDGGDLIDPITSGIVSNITDYNIRQPWRFGDMGPAETAWRRSSYWPFIVQKILALTKPAIYCSLMYDPSRLKKNIANQWVYGDKLSFLNPGIVVVPQDKNTLTGGFSQYVVEIGLQRNRSYIRQLLSDLGNLSYNLFYKVGGFVSKEKLQILIDAIDPSSSSPGAILPPEDYSLLLNVSNPVSSVSASGIIIQKLNGKYIVKGYDNKLPYFTVYTPIRNINTPSITIGGLSETFVNWANATGDLNKGIDSLELTTANSSQGGTYYQVGQIVYYKNTYYRVKVAHKNTGIFQAQYFQSLPSLPIKGGATVQTCKNWDKTPKIIPYGTEFSNIQDVYDFIIGYGEWLISKGFILDQHNIEFSDVVDFNFSAKEFLFWVTQNWAENSIITLSPFADQVKFKLSGSVVDNIFNNFYDYSILQANGIPLPKDRINVTREDGLAIIKTVSDLDGIYFITINSVQKEHGMVFNNSTMFNDTIYDLETGYRQQRMKLVGFRTKDWDGDYFSPGFVYDVANIANWTSYTDYRNGDVVKFAGKYYIAKDNVPGVEKFNFESWVLLNEKPTPDLLPNFDYKIRQFEDFYSLDIDNFDKAQQNLAQHLVGYTPRVYLNNIFTNPVSQYKFYQGFIKEKGTKNSVRKLAKASIYNLQGELDFTEEWAFRVGYFGSYETFKELEIKLPEGEFVENPQVINFVTDIPSDRNHLIYYNTSSDRLITPTEYNPSKSFIVENGIDLLELPTAGYVRFDDINLTAFNENTLLDTADNRNLNEGDYVWLGFKKNGDWDVFRYSLQSSKIVSSFMTPAELGQITFQTKGIHGVGIGDIVSISQFDDTVNGIYRVIDVPKLNQVTVEYSSTTFVSELNPDVPGLLFKFETARYPSFNQLPNDSKLLKLPYESKLWVDDDGSGSWQVYKKIDNYDYSTFKSFYNVERQKLGYSFSKPEQNGLFAVGAPGYVFLEDTGSVLVFKEDTNVFNYKFRFSLNDDTDYHKGPSTEFGTAVIYESREFNDSGFGIFYVGAPATSFIGDVTGIYSTGTSTVSSFVNQGAIKISSVEPILVEEQPQRVVVSPNQASYEKFGTSLHLLDIDTSRKLFVGAPFTRTVGTGSVYVFNISTANSVVSLTHSQTLTRTLSTGSRFGTSIHGTLDGSYLAIGAPGSSNNSGTVFLYTGTNIVYNQSLISPFGKNGSFGQIVKFSPLGEYLFVVAPDTRGDDQSYGKVVVYKQNISGYEFLQIIDNPVNRAGMKFGQSLDVNTDATELVISAIGTNKNVKLTFDRFSLLLANGLMYQNDPDSDLTDQETTFDSGTTRFFDTVRDSGTAYIYNRKTDLFRLADELGPVVTNTVTNFGYSITMNDNNIYIGAPALKPESTSSMIFQFFKKDQSVSSLDLLRSRDTLVNVDTIQKITLIDSKLEEVVEYLDVIDPVKGKIAGIAEENLKYKSIVDPAIYSIGNDSTVNDVTTNWLDTHVGELWWDLSTVKYISYEQGDLLYRKNNWGRLFPGCTIDVYEWIGSELLPSEWAAQADTSYGLTSGISGQPKHPDNTVMSIKQVYNSINNSFTNVYYYWVKNKITVPDVPNRRLSAFQVSSIIQDPTAYGLRYASIIDSDAISLSNVGNLLIDSRITLNLTSDIINNNIPRHTEWLILQEGNENSTPNSLLEKKLFDSLLGHDSLGNPVPDPNLSVRERCGIQIRPRQTMFRNRFEALRNLIEYANSILIKERVRDTASFINLDSQESIPDVYSREYDQIVEDNEGLLLIETGSFVRAEISCQVYNGRIVSVSIDNPGYGYKLPPEITIIDNKDASLLATIDDQGRIINVDIEDSGLGFEESPILTVRNYTVIVLADRDYNGKWTKFSYDTANDQWLRTETQKFNTTLYWESVDWVSDNYNQNKDFEYTLEAVYEIEKLENIKDGDYVKIKNGGLGTFIVLEKVASNGTFGNGYDIIYAENGTIQIKDTVYTYQNSDLTFDNLNSFDQTLYDQTPDIELEYILTAIKDDLFIGNLKKYWNKFFFTAVKYALSEQKLLDWAFKTSFINVTNNAGSLDQRPVYKLQDSSFYEDYLKEVKPYHTKIRNFTTKYNQIENDKTYITDFDVPAIYDKELDKFTTIELGNDILADYPWKAWADNYKMGVGSISVSEPGVGYSLVPAITIIPAVGDTVLTTATAVAYIRSGEVSEVEIINPGYGYTKPPSIVFSGGGTVTTQAKAYALLDNNKVRSITVGLKFDRTSRAAEFNSIDFVDTFIGNGADLSFTLTWLADDNKAEIIVELDGSLVLGSEYKLEYFTGYYGEQEEYLKHYSKITFLYTAPDNGQLITVKYKKNINALNAVDRIINYYKPTAGMPGLDLSQLMTGIDYPRTRIEGLMFDYTTRWGLNWLTDTGETTSSYGISSWADDIGSYKQISLKAPASSGTDTLFLENTDGVSVGQFTNIISASKQQLTATLFFSQTGYVDTKVYVKAVNTVTGAVKFSSTITQNLTATFNYVYIDNVLTTITNTATIEFWSYDTDTTILDSAIIGGAWTTSTNLTATDTLYYQSLFGIDPNKFVTTTTDITDVLIIGTAVDENPEDLIIDGDGFITPNTSYAPEELIPGEINESLGINVYTRHIEGAPTVVSSYISVEAGQTATYKLSMVPPNNDSIFVNFEGKIFTYVTNTNFTSSTQYTIDWTITEPTITIPAQSVNGQLGYSIISIGGGRDELEAGVIDFNSVDVFNTTTAQVVSLAQIGTVKSAYVTVNGESTNNFTLVEFTTNSNRASVIVNGIDPYTTASITAWFLGSTAQYFNEIREEIFVLTTNTFTLNNVPGTIQPYVAQVIIEYKNAVGKRLLLPPHVDYYEILNVGKLVYDINQTGANSSNTKVYKNGVELRYGFDYTISSNKVTFVSALSFKDVIAVVAAVSGTYEYNIDNDILTTDILGATSSDEIRVITFNNHDDMLMRTEVFQGNPTRRYRISRPALDQDYVWVAVNGIPLANHYDYEILDDTVTVQISDEFNHSSSDKIQIVTLNSSRLSSTVLGYRIFYDVLGRTHYKRLSKNHSTYLTKELKFTDVTIEVADPSVLTPPITSKNIPGVILVDGERIEFFQINGNVLSQLRRSTLGTSPSFYSEMYTKVIDQGTNQTVPYADRLLTQVFYTDPDIDTYVINTQTVMTSTVQTNHLGIVVSYNTVTSHGIELKNIKNVRLEDQVTVVYGGRVLRKDGTFYQDISKSYDSPIINFNTTTDIGIEFTASLTSLPLTEVIGTAYIYTVTNQVWVYSNSKKNSAINGYEYTGLDYLEPEFSINTITNALTLNMDKVEDNVKLLVIKKEFDRQDVWNDELSTLTTVTLMDSETVQARFLQSQPSELPDKYYYGGDPALTEDSGFAITDEDNEPLEGY